MPLASQKTWHFSLVKQNRFNLPSILRLGPLFCLFPCPFTSSLLPPSSAFYLCKHLKSFLEQDTHTDTLIPTNNTWRSSLVTPLLRLFSPPHFGSWKLRVCERKQLHLPSTFSAGCWPRWSRENIWQRVYYLCPRMVTMCYRLNVCVPPPPRFLCWSSNPTVMVFGSGALEGN